MKRESLRRTLAFAIVEELGTHKHTIPNIERYVLPKKHKYRINKNEKITTEDILIATLIITHVLMQKPIAFRYGVGDVWTEKRKTAFMSCDLPVDRSSKI